MSAVITRLIWPYARLVRTGSSHTAAAAAASASLAARRPPRRGAAPPRGRRSASHSVTGSRMTLIPVTSGGTAGHGMAASTVKTSAANGG